MRRALAVLTVCLLALAGCGGDSDSGSAGAGAGTSAEPTGSESPTQPPSDEPTQASGGTSGCDLVTPEMIQAALGVDAGEGVPQESVVDGPDSCQYATIFAIVQVTGDPDLYAPSEAWCASPTASEVPAGADRGCADTGLFMVVKGDVGVIFTAGVEATPDQFRALAEATVAKL